jgi:UDP-N-acetylmuramyl tripeptide synthase
MVNRIPWRTRVAIAMGALAAKASRSAGRGEGMVIGGKVMFRISPDVMIHLAGNRVAALVSATNGKSSTTRLLATAVTQLGPVTTQRTGANMDDGIVEALSHGDLDAPAVLEVDEAYLPMVLTATRAKTILLGNLTRDQLDRMNEVGMLARRWRAMLQDCPAETTVIANSDDPIVTWAARHAPRVVWVAAGQNWTADASVCLECGSLMNFSGPSWACTKCDFAAPESTWQFHSDDEGYFATGPPGRFDLSNLGLPGWFNAANATLCLAATGVLGLDPQESVRRMASVKDVSGRYETRQIGALKVRLLLAKNPASWSETLTIMPPAPTPVIVTINSNDADGHDPSWLWDVPFEKLRGRTVIASGDRRRDLAVRLLHAGVDHVAVANPYAVDAPLPEGVRDLESIDCAATYTAFHNLRTRGTSRAPGGQKRGR